jgi:hypothetical protein
MTLRRALGCATDSGRVERAWGSCVREEQKSEIEVDFFDTVESDGDRHYETQGRLAPLEIAPVRYDNGQCLSLATCEIEAGRPTIRVAVEF